MAWAVAELPRFYEQYPGKTPSVDRRQHDYLLGAIQLIPKDENSGRTSRTCCKSFKQFCEIWAWITKSNATDSEIAKRFSFSPQTVGRIRKGETYKQYRSIAEQGVARIKKCRGDLIQDCPSPGQR